MSARLVNKRRAMPALPKNQMFELSFGKMMIIAIVALIVLGPEKLPKVARTLGHLLGRARSYANQVKQDIDREMQMDELRKLQQQAQDRKSVV